MMQMHMHGFMGKCWKWCHNKSLGLLILRLVLGAFFIGNGVAKLQSMSSTVTMFGQWGFGPFWAWTETLAEVVAGAAIALGAFMWLAAALIVIIMIVAVYVVIGPNPNGESSLFHFIFGWGPNAIYAAAAVCLAFTGPGKWSLGGWWMRRRGAACMQCKADHGMECECKKDDSGGHAPDCSCATCGCEKKE
jgi:uncharacterized membrane protein YphA (DoxX/SURF4 family)